MGQATTRTGAIAGRVVDEGGSPVAGVEVRVGALGGTSDSAGRFLIEGVDPGSRRVHARRLGFAPESLLSNVSAARVDSLRFVVRAVAATLDGFDVVGTNVTSARLQAFEGRRERKNGGQFITRADIERRMPDVTSDLIRRMQGVRVLDSMGVQLAVSTRGPKPDLRNPRPTAPCVVRIGVDGILKEPYFPINTIPVGDVHGIELYSGPATIPPEFGGSRRDAGCGLIMIWTRSR